MLYLLIYLSWLLVVQVVAGTLSWTVVQRYRSPLASLMVWLALIIAGVITENTAKFDGKDYPVKGAAAPNTTRAFKRIDDHIMEFTTKVDGKPTTSTRVVISQDGRTHTLTTTGKNARGQTVNSVVVYEKE